MASRALRARAGILAPHIAAMQPFGTLKELACFQIQNIRITAILITVSRKFRCLDYSEPSTPAL